MDKMRRNKKGFTLLEVIFTLTLIVFLISSVLFVYIVAFKNSYYLGNRTDVHEKLHFALERIVRDVRKANVVSVANNAVTFTLNESGVDTSYRYYLYNASDVWPPAFNQTTYDLRRAAVTGFAYGNGDLIVSGLDKPSNTSITSSGNVAKVTLGVTPSGDKLFSISGYVRPRNA